MTLATIVMFVVAGVAASGGLIALVAIRGASEGAVYARRLIATILLALGGILGFFAWSMAGWEARS